MSVNSPLETKTITHHTVIAHYKKVIFHSLANLVPLDSLSIYYYVSISYIRNHSVIVMLYAHGLIFNNYAQHQFQKYIFSLGIGVIQFLFSFLMWTDLLSSGSSRVPTYRTVFPRCGTCHTDKLASLPITPRHDDTYCHTDKS